MSDYRFPPGRLSTLPDVALSGLANGDGLTYNSSTQKWTNAPAGAIADGSVTNAKLANVATATFKGRATSGTGAPEDLTVSQARTLLGLATVATSGSASDLGTGTLPDGRFPATLPAASGANLTNVNAATLGGTSLSTLNSSIASKLDVAGGTINGDLTLGVGAVDLPKTLTLLMTPGTPSTPGALGYLDFYDNIAEATRVRLIGSATSALRGQLVFQTSDIYGTLTNALTIAYDGTVSAAGQMQATYFAGSGVYLTALNATQLTSGTIPDARFPSTLPALNGSALTALNASNLGSGTVPDARFPSTLPALNGSALTALNATQLTSGTVPAARLGNLNERPTWDSTQAFIIPTGNGGFFQYNHATRPISAFCWKSGSTSLQTGTIRFAPYRVPFGFAAYKTTGALVLDIIATNATSTNCKITGITLYGTNDLSASPTTLYTDSTARNVTTADVSEQVSINPSSFSSTAIFTWLILEITCQAKDAYAIGVINASVNAE